MRLTSGHTLMLATLLLEPAAAAFWCLLRAEGSKKGKWGGPTSGLWSRLAPQESQVLYRTMLYCTILDYCLHTLQHFSLEGAVQHVCLCIIHRTWQRLEPGCCSHDTNLCLVSPALPCSVCSDEEELGLAVTATVEYYGECSQHPSVHVNSYSQSPPPLPQLLLPHQLRLLCLYPFAIPVPLLC